MNSVSLYTHSRPINPLVRLQPMLSFGLLRAHLFLGSFPAFVYLRPVTVIFCLWAKFSPRLQSARFVAVNTLGRFHSVIKYGRLTMTRYGRPMNGQFQVYPIYDHNVVCYWPMFGQPIIRPVEGPLMIRPVEGPLCLRPI